MGTVTGVHSLDQALMTLHEWLKDISDELGVGDKEDAFVITRAVLVALRDRLTVEEAADFAAQLPMMLQGVYFHGYKPGNKPLKMKTRQEFVDYVDQNLNRDIDPVDAIHIVYAVLKRRISPGQLADTISGLPQEIAALWIEE
jgi:uncharacterized protein (DUF2267 family)